MRPEPISAESPLAAGRSARKDRCRAWCRIGVDGVVVRRPESCGRTQRRLQVDHCVNWPTDWRGGSLDNAEGLASRQTNVFRVELFQGNKAVVEVTA